MGHLSPCLESLGRTLYVYIFSLKNIARKELMPPIPVEVEPVAGDVDGHAQLEEEHVTRVEVRQRHQQAHRRTAISQLVQHRAELGTCHNR